MKKLAILLTALLCLCMAGVSSAEPYHWEKAGMTLEVPEGISVKDVSSDAWYGLSMSIVGHSDLEIALVLAYQEELAGLWTQDLTDEEATAIGMALAQMIEDPQIELYNEEDQSYLYVYDAAGTQIHYINIMDGWLMDVAIVDAHGHMLTEHDIDLYMEVLNGITYE